jgi:hypothetical protein
MIAAPRTKGPPLILNPERDRALDTDVETPEGRARARVLRVAEESPFALFLVPEASGLELAAATGDDRPGHRRLKLFLDRPDRAVAFFYKASSVPASRDRYAYGTVKVPVDSLDDGRVEAWLAFLDRGFPALETPEGFRRGAGGDVPPDPEGAAGGADAVGEPRREAWDEGPERPLSPIELEISLLCRGVRIDPSAELERDARHFSRTRAGLGSGLELVLPGRYKELWVNVPVEEDFARASPYRIEKREGTYRVVDDRRGHVHPVRVPGEPAWYTEATSRGTPMHRVGVLQGTYLGIYISNSCGYWHSRPSLGCRFCTTGANVGVNEVTEKDVEDVVEVARAAKERSGVTFVHLNSGFQGGDRDIDTAIPYIRALKERVGVLVGVQLLPSRDLSRYDRLAELGVDHLSFCYELHNPEFFADWLPGKEKTLGQRPFYEALAYGARRFGRGTCSGEIIAGIEPIEDTLRAIDMITSLGAFPTVCIFRPLIGAEREDRPSPREADMIRVMRHVYLACRRESIPIGLAPNIEVSLIVNPDDARELAPPGPATWWYETKRRAMRLLARPLFRRRMRPRRPARPTRGAPHA